MYSKILELLVSAEDVAKLQEEVALLKKALFQTPENKFAKALKTQVRAQVAQLFQEEWQAEKIERDGYDAYFDGLDEVCGQLKTIKIDLAYQPTQSDLEEMVEWVQKAGASGASANGTPARTILEFHHHPDIMGGAVIEYEGRYFDASLQKKVSTSLQKAMSAAEK
jgi:hypothetical protein